MALIIELVSLRGPNNHASDQGLSSFKKNVIADNTKNSAIMFFGGQNCTGQLLLSDLMRRLRKLAMLKLGPWSEMTFQGTHR